MLNKRTLLEIIYLIENWNSAEIDRFALIFAVEIPEQLDGLNLSKAKKANLILTVLEKSGIRGPFTENAQLDAVQYIFEKFLRENPPQINELSLWSAVLEPVVEQRKVDTLFIEHYPRLYNSFKRDGYSINENGVVPLLPSELVESNTENELFRFLEHFNFNTSKGHLEQAIENHTNSNWAGANGQFRTYMESLLIEISNYLLPERNCTNIGDAINWLSNPAILNPILLHQHLNEVPVQGLNFPFINGLWKRLHPTGSHPGLSDEEDSTFRYHTLVVFTRYLLSRLKNRV